MQYLYADGDLFNFMNMETYDQMAVDKDTVGDSLKFVKRTKLLKYVLITEVYSLSSRLCLARTGDH